MEVARHHPVETEYAVPRTLKHVTAVLMIVVYVLSVEMGNAPDRRTVQHVPTIVEHVCKNPPVEMGSVQDPRIAAHAQTIVAGPVPYLHALMGKVWTAMETV